MRENMSFDVSEADRKRLLAIAADRNTPSEVVSALRSRRGRSVLLHPGDARLRVWNSAAPRTPAKYRLTSTSHSGL